MKDPIIEGREMDESESDWKKNVFCWEVGSSE
jgi:hypothetical protein